MMMPLKNHLFAKIVIMLIGALLVFVPVPSLAVPVALFTIEPASRSAWVMVWLAVQVTEAAGARVAGVAGQVTLTLSSATA